MTDRKSLLIWLSNCIGTYVRSGDKLYEHFGGSVEAIYGASGEEYAKIKGLNEKVAARLSDKSLKEAEEIETWCESHDVSVVTVEDDLYPKRLFAVDSHPFVLYCKGNLIQLDKKLCVALVGTRRMTQYGSSSAYDMAYDLAKAGAVVVSGMADGIDGMAHRGCLDAGGYTIAVLGNGIDRAYPAFHYELMEEIAQKGCVLTEFCPFTKPERYNFPLRNRVISGISQATLVIEAPEKSGALNTAQHCLAQHRRLYAVPGKIGELTNVGTNVLIKDGARAVTYGREIIDDYAERYPSLDPSLIPTEKVKKGFSPGFLAGYMPKRSKPKQESPAVKEEAPKAEPPKTPKIETDGLSENEIAVLRCFDDGKPVNATEAAEITGLPIRDVLTSITMLEICGRIQHLSGDDYILI